MLKLDTELFLLLNAGTAPNAAVAWVAIFVARFVILAIPLYLAGLWVVGGRHNRLSAMALGLALALAIVVSYAVGMAVFRPRPFMIGLGHLLIEHRANASFPSNHGLTFAVCAAVLFLCRRQSAAWLAVALGTLVAWSRIYVGIHYPLDMIGAAIIAIPVAMASLWIMDRHGPPLLAALERVQRAMLAPFVGP